MKKVLLIGRSGLLGSAFARLLAARDIRFDAPTRAQFNIARDQYNIPPGRYDAVINCAAMTAVDHAETNPARALEVNGDGPKNLVRCLGRHGAMLVHVSTDYVFSGDPPAAFCEDDRPNPINQYGHSKRIGEEAVANYHRPLILRTSWLFGDGPCFPLTIAEKLISGGSAQVVDDQHGRPTHVDSVAHSALDLMAMGQTGIFHVADGPPTTWFGLAQEVAGALDLPERVSACPTQTRTGTAPRPRSSVLSVAKCETALGRKARLWGPPLVDLVRRFAKGRAAD